VSLTPRQAVELFHLVFLRALTARGEDKALIGLKGGCNLRFYFDSVRYSEDIDFDVVVMSKDTLKRKVDRLLESPAVTAPLKTRGIEVVEVSAPKQTETTQRWKAGLVVTGMSLPLRTKIEFSRRKSVKALDGAAYESPAPSTLKPYALTPFLTTHYAVEAAVRQKLGALASRTEPQARDVFDLNVLFARPDVVKLVLSTDEKALLPAALENAIGISYDEYVSKVVAYLEPEHAAIYEERSAWDLMQETVVGHIEGLR